MTDERRRRRRRPPYVPHTHTHTHATPSAIRSISRRTKQQHTHRTPRRDCPSHPSPSRRVAPERRSLYNIIPFRSLRLYFDILLPFRRALYIYFCHIAVIVVVVRDESFMYVGRTGEKGTFENQIPPLYIRSKRARRIYLCTSEPGRRCVVVSILIIKIFGRQFDRFP